MKVGDKVLVPEYGGTKVTFEEKVCLYFSLRVPVDVPTLTGLLLVPRR